MKITIDTDAPPKEIADQINKAIGAVFVTTRELAEIRHVSSAAVRQSPKTYAETEASVTIYGLRLYDRRGIKR